MLRIGSVSLVLVFGSIPFSAQSLTPAPPQTARQALIEMFVGKGPDDFMKHLPEAARQALIHKGDTPETSVLLRISMIGRQVAVQGEHVETFDAGPSILITEQNNGHEKFEAMMEHDSLMGEEEEIELSVHSYKDGQEQRLPVVPRLIFTLKQEKEVWRLTEVTAAAHVPLTDPDYLKGLRKEQDDSNARSAQNRVTAIAMAEKGYAARHPDRGYTCTLAMLATPEPGAAQGEAGFVYDPGQGSEEWSGYRFALSGCDGTPAAKYRITAVPLDSDSEMKMFCADESGSVKSVSGAKSSTCFSRGEVMNPGNAPSETSD